MSAWKLLPPPDGHCRICGRDHEPEQPHDAGTLFYLTRFQLRYGRAGTWADAVAHCSEPVRSFWERELRRANAWTVPAHGVDVVAEPIDD